MSKVITGGESYSLFVHGVFGAFHLSHGGVRETRITRKVWANLAVTAQQVHDACASLITGVDQTLIRRRDGNNQQGSINRYTMDHLCQASQASLKKSSRFYDRVHEVAPSCPTGA